MGAPQQVLLAGGYVVNLTDKEILSAGAGTQTATLTLASNGQSSQTTTSGGSSNHANEWTRPVTPVGSLFEVRATITSGSMTSGTFGSWLSLSTDRSWSKTITVIGTDIAVVQVQIRRASDSVVVATANITFNVERTI